MGLIVRRFEWGDAPTLLSLFRDTVQRVNSRDYSPEQVAAWSIGRPDPGRWSTLFAERYTVVAQIDGKIVGFAELEIDGHIDRLFVHADHQREGVGRALMADILAEVQRLGTACLHSEVSITARPFFERFGFAVLAEQTVEHRGLQFTNYRMERVLHREESVTF